MSWVDFSNSTYTQLLAYFFTFYILWTLTKRYFGGGKCPKKYFKNIRGKTIMITGANSGLGLESAKMFVKHHAKRVILLCRDEKKASKTVETLQKLSDKIGRKIRKKRDDFEGTIINHMVVELSSFVKIKIFAESFLQFVNDYKIKLDVLLLNAGSLNFNRQVTIDGIEWHYQVNYLANFYLCKLLYEHLKKNSTRCVVLSSRVARMVTDVPFYKNIKNVMFDKKKIFSKIEKHNTFALYGMSKLACIYFAKELQRLFHKDESTASCLSCHPGIIVTNLIQYSWWKFLRSFLYPLLITFTKNLNQGIQTQILLCTAPNEDLNMGGYYIDCAIARENKRYMKRKKEQKLLWKISNEIVEEIEMKMKKK